MMRLYRLSFHCLLAKTGGRDVTRSQYAVCWVVEGMVLESWYNLGRVCGARKGCTPFVSVL